MLLMSTLLLSSCGLIRGNNVQEEEQFVIQETDSGRESIDGIEVEPETHEEEVVVVVETAEPETTEPETTEPQTTEPETNEPMVEVESNEPMVEEDDDEGTSSIRPVPIKLPTEEEDEPAPAETEYISMPESDEEEPEPTPIIVERLPDPAPVEREPEEVKIPEYPDELIIHNPDLLLSEEVEDIVIDIKPTVPDEIVVDNPDFEDTIYSPDEFVIINP